jgi:hypothetical protein
VGGLVGRSVEVITDLLADHRNGFRVHGLGDLAHFLDHEAVHLDVVFLPVEGHAQQRLAVGIAVGRIQIEVVATVGLVRAVGVHRHLVGVVIGGRAFPLAAPGRRAGRVRGAGNRPAAGLVDPHRRAADEAVRAVVEVVGVEVIQRHRCRPRR